MLFVVTLVVTSIIIHIFVVMSIVTSQKYKNIEHSINVTYAPYVYFIYFAVSFFTSSRVMD